MISFALYMFTVHVAMALVVWHTILINRELSRYKADANRLATVLRAYLENIDRYSKHIGDPSLKLESEREAVRLHDELLKK